MEKAIDSKTGNYSAGITLKNATDSQIITIQGPPESVAFICFC